jgi:hypothetical protein
MLRFNSLLEDFNKKGIDSDVLYDDVIQVAIYVFEWMKKNLFFPSKVENFNFIIDLNGIGVTSAPFSLIKNLIQVMQTNYRCMAWWIFVLGACFSIRMAWKAVDMILNDSTRKKIVLTGDMTDKALKEIMEPSNLEKKYGGKAEDVKVFWPPQMPAF